MTFSITKLIGVDYLLNLTAAILYATGFRLFGGRSVCNEMESGTDHDGTAAADTILRGEMYFSFVTGISRRPMATFSIANYAFESTYV